MTSPLVFGWSSLPPTLGEASAPPKNSPANPQQFWGQKSSGLRQRLQEWCHRTAFQGVFFFFGFFGTEENPTLEPTVGGFYHGRTYGLLCWALEMTSGHLDYYPIIIRVLYNI